MARLVALLRGVNVGGNRKVPMKDLRALAEGLGWVEVGTYLASGNLVFTAGGKPPALEAALEEALHARFGFPVDVVVRTAAQWEALAASNPFAEAARDRPKALHLGLAKRPLAAGAAEALLPRLRPAERVAQTAGGLWLDFGEGLAGTRLTPKVLDQAAGSPLTARNFRTVEAVRELLRSPAG